MAVWNDYIIKYETGSRISPAVDLSPVDIALVSEITWEATTPSGTSIIIETALSFDGGNTWGDWHECESGGAIPGIGKGSDLANVHIRVRETFTTENTSKTARLQYLRLNVRSAYKDSSVFTSDALDASLAILNYDAIIPDGTTLTVEYRELQDEDNWSGWSPIQNNKMIGGNDKLQYRAVFTTEDIAVTPVLSEVKLVPIKYFALSPEINTSDAKDKDSGKVVYEAIFAEGVTAEIRTRTSADGLTWEPWEPIDASGDISSTKQDYAQMLIVTHAEGESDEQAVIINTISLSYDGTPAAEELASGFTAGSQFYFTSLMSKLVIFNKLNAPKKWDGASDDIEDLDGDPPHGQYAATHKNYLFTAGTHDNPSRLYWSEILNIDEWNALSFIDISPNDGDWITGILPYSDYLIITKQRSTWALLGSMPGDFTVIRLDDNIGCIAPRSLVKVPKGFAFVSTEGVYISDLSNPIKVTERIKATWDKLNRRRLSSATAMYYDNKLRVDIPSKGSTVNNMRIIFDTIRQCLYIEQFNKHASCYTKFIEAGEEILLYGHSTEGQISRADVGTSDAGAPIEMVWEPKWFNFGSSLVRKKIRRTYLAMVPANTDTDISIAYLINGVVEGTLETTIPGADEGEAKIKLNPRDIDIRNVETSLGYRIAQSAGNGGVRFHELVQEFRTGRIKV